MLHSETIAFRPAEGPFAPRNVAPGQAAEPQTRAVALHLDCASPSSVARRHIWCMPMRGAEHHTRCENYTYANRLHSYLGRVSALHFSVYQTRIDEQLTLSRSSRWIVVFLARKISVGHLRSRYSSHVLALLSGSGSAIAIAKDSSRHDFT